MMDSISFRVEDGEILVDLFSGEDCHESIPLTLEDAIRLRSSLDDAISQASRAANDSMEQT